MSESAEQLTELFAKFPGIGPRQAKRFVYHLLQQPEASRTFLAQKILSLKSEMSRCEKCKRFYSLRKTSNATFCNLCADTTRNASLLLVVARDVDLETIEKTRSYSGQYFILGGQLKLLDKSPESHIRIIELEALLKNNPNIQEVILAMNANTEGDFTAEYVRSKLLESFPTRDLKISLLGRGLSTGTELEYSDSDTITYALKNRF